jgi:hypothetical protein
MSAALGSPQDVLQGRIPIPFHTTVVQQAVVELTSHDLLVRDLQGLL